VDYKSLYNIEIVGSYFVARMKSNGTYKRVQNNPHNSDGNIISDILIELTRQITKTYYPKKLRIKNIMMTRLEKCMNS